jgi:hypothetical protein
MRTSKKASSLGKYFALRTVSCCAIFIGAFFKFPPNLRDSAVSLRAKVIDPDVVSLPTNETNYVPVASHDDGPEKESTPEPSFKPTSAPIPNPTPKPASVKLDFFVAGFPKCGTTTLLKTFEAHNETAVHPEEECSIAMVRSDDEAYHRLMKNLNEASSDPNVKRGIKCPVGLSTHTSIERLQHWFPDTKLIFGLRHPVYYFQSFYNYRVLEFHQNKLKTPIPSPESLIGSHEWARVSTEAARFDKVLKKLGKTNSDETSPTPFKVFLYTLEQMEDENEERGQRLRETVGSFLELQHQIKPLQAANINHFVGDKAFPETIDICDTKFNHLRRVLVNNGKKSQRWIREEFLQSPDVTVANAEHFDEILKQWAFDPCVKEDTPADKD